MSDYVFNYSQYKNSIHKKSYLSFLSLFFVIIILLGLCVFIKPRKSTLLEFYFVEVDNFPIYQNAINLCNELNSNGVCGYVYFDGVYHVLVSFYSSYDDAEKVCDNINKDYPNSSVFTISTNRFSNKKDLEKSQNNSIKNFLESTEKIILQLESSLVKFEKGEIQLNNLSLLFKDIKKDFDAHIDNLYIAFKTNSKYNLMKEYANQISKSISNISTFDEQNLSSFLRYEILNIVINRCQFLSCF